MPAPHYIHPEFGFLCPTQRFRRRLRLALACLAVVGAGAVVISTSRALKDPEVNAVDHPPIAEATAATSLAPFTAGETRLPIVAGAHTNADKPSCVGDSRTEGNCVSVNLRKPRMVWAGNVRPTIAAVALGHSAAPMTGILDAVLPTASAELVAATNSAQPQKAVAKPKKEQRSANRQNARRDQYRNVAPFWREVRVNDWAARGYAPRERDYQRSAYGRGGFTPNFW